MIIIKNQQGSASAEFVILALVMIPLFFMMPTLGKITDVNHSTIQASRYMAWERTVSTIQNKNEEKLATELHNRFFVSPDLGINTEDQKITDDKAVNPFWKFNKVNADGEKPGLLDSSQGEKITLEESTDKDLGRAGTLSNGIAEVGDMMAGVLPKAKWDLKGNGLYIGTVYADVSNAGLLSHTAKDCANKESAETFACIKRHNAIMVDGWNAFSKNDVEERTRSFVPGAVLQPIGELISAASVIPLLKEVEGLEDAFGHVDVDVLPLDRYEVK